MRLLDLFCGRFGWSRAFAARGWECVGIDLVDPPEIPEGCTFYRCDVLDVRVERNTVVFRAEGPGLYGEVWLHGLDFICASSPCEQFSVHGMKHFHPNPPYPELGIKLFNHTRTICEASGLPYVMENVRAAQKFCGNAVNHCGPFYLWGTGVPPILPQGMKKGFQMGASIIQKLKWVDRAALTEYRRQNDFMWSSSKSAKRKEATAQAAMIPPELSACVADYAERMTEVLA